MKGLRPVIKLAVSLRCFGFLPCDLNEGITTRTWLKRSTAMSRIFTLWPEWRDYDISPKAHTVPLDDLIFTLWPEWRDYDWLTNRDLKLLSGRFLPCDLNEGITTRISWLPPFRSLLDFYLVTWMKGLRQTREYGVLTVPLVHFYLVTWMKGLRQSFTKRMTTSNACIFTLWPEWRDYDKVGGKGSGRGREFLPCDLNEGITTITFTSDLYFVTRMIFTLWPEWRDYDYSIGMRSYYQAAQDFYLVTWMKGLRQISSGPSSCWCTPFLPCDLNEGITTGEELSGFYHFTVRIFTLWPEWRDYDGRNRRESCLKRPHIFTLWPEWRDYDAGRGCYVGHGPPDFYLVTWMKGLRLLPREAK